MRATTLLMEEHELILRGLRVLDTLAAKAARGEEVPAPAVETLLGFFTGFADAHHHHKEEEILFPAMEEAGFPRDAGPIGVMLHEHDEGRARIAALRASPAGTGFAEAARAYALLLRAHIEKENRILFPMAERAIERADQQRVDAAFDDFEAGAAAERTRLAGDLERLADQLLDATRPQP